MRLTDKEIDDWFCSLPVKRKEHIATKILRKTCGNLKDGLYPKCFSVWTKQMPETKRFIYEHCTNDHGDWIQEGGDAPIYSF